MQPLTIIFIGPQGSGKGTQIEKLDAVLTSKFPEVDTIDFQTGRRFRALAMKGEGYTEEHVAETLDSGVLQPLFLSVVLWGDAMREHMNPERNVLIDGFPRTVAEAIVLESAFSFYKRNEIIIINLQATDEVVRGRMIARSRKDDTMESIEARLKWYREETKPVLEYYENRPNTRIMNIDGTGTIEQVHAEILLALNISQ
jgi:adenylate kinase